MRKFWSSMTAQLTTVEVVETYSGVRLITQVNAGPAAARNRGAVEAQGTIILFTDDDCVPMLDWLDAMLQPFDDRRLPERRSLPHASKEFSCSFRADRL